MVNIDEINESISKFGAVVDGLSKLDDTYAKVDETNASAKKTVEEAQETLFLIATTQHTISSVVQSSDVIWLKHSISVFVYFVEHSLYYRLSEIVHLSYDSIDEFIVVDLS